MSDRCWDEPPKLVHYGSTSNEAPRKPPGLKLNTILEEGQELVNFAFTNGYERNTNDEFAENDKENVHWLLEKLIYKLTMGFRNGVIAEPSAIEKMFKLKCVMDNYYLPRDTSETVENRQTPPIPPLPEKSNREFQNTVVESKITNGDVFSPALFELETNLNMNITEKNFIDFTTSLSSLPIPPAPPRCNGTVYDETPSKFEYALDDPATTSLDEKPSNGTREPPQYENASIFSKSQTKGFPNLALPAGRKKFEDSLSESTKSFFERIVAQASVPLESSINELHETNPFKADLAKVPPPLPERSLRRPHGSPNSQTRKSPQSGIQKTSSILPESQTRIIYEAPPTKYDTVNNEVTEITREREKLIESKRVNVESWIQHGHNSGNLFTGNLPAPPPIPPRTKSIVNGTTNEVTCNGAKFSGDSLSGSSCRVTPSEWLDAIDSTFVFKRNDKTSPSFEKLQINNDREKNDGEYIAGSDGPRGDEVKQENSRKHEDNVQKAPTETLNHRKCTIEENSGEEFEFRAIPLTNRIVFLIIHQNKGWVAVEEFALVFTNKSPEWMLGILKKQGVDIPFLKIDRSDNPILFNKLDRTSLSVPRDLNNKIRDHLNLVPLGSALKILRKLKIIERAQVERLMERKIVPKDSPVIFDLYNLIKAWREIEQALAMTVIAI